MACKSCGASKLHKGNCAYCGNPSSDKRNIYYVDVAGLSWNDMKSMLRRHEEMLKSYTRDTLLITPTRGMLMSA